VQKPKAQDNRDTKITIFMILKQKTELFLDEKALTHSLTRYIEYNVGHFLLVKSDIWYYQDT